MRWIAGFLSVLIFTIGARAAVTVDFSRGQGPIQHSGNGFLWGITTTAPHDTLISYLKPRMLRAGAQNCNRCAFDIYDRAKRLGVEHIHAIVCEAVGFRQPGTASLSWDAYLSTVTNLVNRAKTENKDFIWDIWNESDYGQFWSGTWDQWLEVWKRTYQAIKAADPNAVITGPSTCECTGSYGDIITVTKFIDYAAANNCMPEIVCWHMNESGYWIDNRHIESDAHRVRLQLAGLGYDTTKILLSSNEYGNAGYVTNAGACVKYFAMMERARFYDGAKACWGGDCDNASLCGILNSSVDGQAPKTWWAYRRYAEMTGQLFDVPYIDDIEGLATYDSSTGVAKILVGSASRATYDVALRIRNLRQKSGTVPVKIEKISYEAPIKTISSGNQTITGDSLLLNLPNFGSETVFAISIGNSATRVAPARVTESIVADRFGVSIRNGLLTSSLPVSLRGKNATISIHDLHGSLVRSQVARIPQADRFAVSIDTRGETLARGRYVVNIAGSGIQVTGVCTVN